MANQEEQMNEMITVLKDISKKMDLLEDLHREMREVKVRINDMKA